MTSKLEELEASRDTAYAASKYAYYVAFDVVAAGARHDAYEDAHLDWIVANDAYQAELKKTKVQSNDQHAR